MNAAESENVMLGLATSRCSFARGAAQPANPSVARLNNNKPGRRLVAVLCICSKGLVCAM